MMSLGIVHMDTYFSLHDNGCSLDSSSVACKTFVVGVVIIVPKCGHEQYPSLAVLVTSCTVQ